METSTARKFRSLSARKLAWLAGVAGLSATVFLAAPSFLPNTDFAPGVNLPELVDQLTPNGRLPSPEEASQMV